MPSIAWLILSFLFGAVFGSFLNVVIDRVPAGLSLISPPSHCSACKKRLSNADLVPIISFLVLRGRCRYCGAKLSWRSFWVEVSTALIFTLLLWNYGPSWNAAIAIAFGCIFVVLIVTDLEQGILPDKIVYTGILLAIAISAAISIDSILTADTSGIIIPAIASALLGGVIGFLFLLIVALIFKGGMGGGDIKLAGMMGLILRDFQMSSLLSGWQRSAEDSSPSYSFSLKSRGENRPFHSARFSVWQQWQRCSGDMICSTGICTWPACPRYNSERIWLLLEQQMEWYNTNRNS